MTIGRFRQAAGAVISGWAKACPVGWKRFGFIMRKKCRLKGSDGIGASGQDLVCAFEHFVQFWDEQEQQETCGCADVEQQPVEADFVARLIAFFKQYAAQSEA